MTIEFRCQQCGRLLRTGEDTVGKQAKCPACQCVQVIPAPVPPVAADEYSVAPPTTPANPFSVPPPPGAPRGGMPPAAPSSDNPYASPVSYGTPITTPQTHGLLPIVPTPIDLGGALSRGWELFKANAGVCVGAIFLFGLITYGMQAVPAIAAALIDQANNGQPPLAFALFQLGFGLVQLVVGTWIQLGLMRFGLRIARCGEAQLGDLFSGGRYLLRGILATILYFILISLIIAVVMIPFFIMLFIGMNEQNPSPLAIAGMVISGFVGAAILVYITLRFWPWQMLLIDRDLGPVDALATAWRITPGNVLSSFLLFLVVGLLTLVSLMACCLPILIAAPVAMLAMAVAYLMMSGQYRTDAGAGITP